MRIRDGPSLVTVLGLTPDHDVPTGWQRRMALAPVALLSRDFAVHVINRKRGLQPGESMFDIASHLANAIEHAFGEPVFLHGTSTGVCRSAACCRPA